MQKQKIQQFTDLIVWQKAHGVVLSVYQLTKKFPAEEVFGLSAQLRRAAVSITSNIAEGFGRMSAKEKVHFYLFAYGSLLEIINQLIIAKDLKYLSVDTFSKLFESSMEIHKMLNGLIYSLK